MTHTLEEIKKMLEGISPWPWHSDRANHICDKEGRCVYWADGIQEGPSGSDSEFIASAPQIISELMEEVEYWQKRHADLSDSKTNEYHAGYKDGYDEAKHGAEARYSLAKELREQVQLLMNKNKELEPAAFAFTLSQYSDRDPMRNEIYRLMKDAQERQKVKKPSS